MARHPRYIETIARRGYRVIADVEQLEAQGRAPDTASRPLRGALKLVTPDREYILHDGENIIGRSSDAAICIDSARVSRHHARVLVSDRRAVLEDLGSKNGTFVEARRLTGPVELCHGARIQIGRGLIALRFADEGEATLSESNASTDQPRES